MSSVLESRERYGSIFQRVYQKTSLLLCNFTTKGKEVNKVNKPGFMHTIILKLLSKINICMLFIACLLSCKNEKTFRLEKYALRSENLDTVAYFAKHDIYLLGVKDYGFLGDFKSGYVFTGRKDSLGYKIDSDNLQVELSKKYLGLINEGDHSSGWFNVKEHKVLSSIPKVDSIVVSLEKIPANQLVQENNGIFTIYAQGKLVRKFTLGEFLIKNDSVNYDDLEFGIYRVKNERLVKVNNDGTKLSEQIDGLYFVPSPGFNVINFRQLNDILPEISAALKKHPLPEEIRIK